MKKTLISFVLSIFIIFPAFADNVKIGIILGFTGPIESLAPVMAKSAEMAINEVNKSGKFSHGKIDSVRGDSTCVDAAAAQAAAERLITSEKVNAIMGADCSGVTTAVLKNVAMPNGIVMISPSATSPALSTEPDNGLFFRTAPSDARQGEVIADLLMEKGYKTAALSHTNNDYGKGLAASIEKNFTSKGGKITITASHEDGKADYSAEVAALAQAGGDILIVAGYLDQGGKGIIQASLDSDAFSKFFLPDGMIGDALPKAIGPDLNGSIGSVPGTDSPGAAKYSELANKAGFKSGPYGPESYDGAALIMLAMEKSKSTKSNVFKNSIMDIANAPGEKIFPGELGKALSLIKAGKDIDYVGATALELVGNGESSGSFAEILIENQKTNKVGYR
ncbi:MAG: ABC transporter substrate-binding protein [Candidatus Puniceispirillales bacterium]|jgi:branched-chain amino acid transport system substrate-binding protein|tara:strand:+ start:147 stop:1325 length:1179 start_codon:yes stop_codon:yes gene_type:complete